MKHIPFSAALILAVVSSHAQTEVSTLADLDNIRNDLGEDYILVNDIDASATADPGYNGGEGWLPIGIDGTSTFRFTGTLDGQGFTISGLTFDRPDLSLAGLFAQLGTDAEILDLHLAEVDFLGFGRVGGIAGMMRDQATITNSSVSGVVRGEFRVGGLVGDQSSGTIENCWTEGEVETFGFNELAGGLVGYANGTIRRSYSTANVSGGDWVGGLAGRAPSDGVIEECFATGDVSGTSSLIGAFVGAHETLIARCYATGNATEVAGGFGGVSPFAGRQGTGAHLQDSFSRGNADGSRDVGGIAGIRRGTPEPAIERCFATGVLTSANATTLGGLVGRNDEGTVADSYWDTESTGGAPPNGGTGETGLTTAEMTTPFSGGAYAGWDFDTVWIEEADANDGYPIHRWQTTRYTLQYEAGPNGRVEGDLFQVRIPGLSGTPVGAGAAAGYEFLAWSDGVTDNPRTDLKVMSDVNVRAIFIDPNAEPTFWMVE